MKAVISIIVIVKNDLGVADTIAGLLKQTKPAPAEIIIVDASKPEVLEEIRQKYKTVKWIEYKAAVGPKSSIPEQRNVGVMASKGDIIVFIDANCVPAKNWLVNLITPILNAEENMSAGSVTASNPRTYVNLNPSNRKIQYLKSSPTINLAFKREVFDKVGGFDENFHFGSDVDFTWRSTDIGYKIRFIPSASVSHDWGSTTDEIKRSYKYGRAKAVLYYKHPNRLKELFREDIFVLIYLAYFVLMPLTFWLPWYPIVIILPMLKNIKSKPFKTVAMNILFTLGLVRQAIFRES